MSVRDSCSWGNNGPAAPPQIRNTKLPPIPAVGEETCLKATHTHTYTHTRTHTSECTLCHWFLESYRITHTHTLQSVLLVTGVWKATESHTHLSLSDPLAEN